MQSWNVGGIDHSFLGLEHLVLLKVFQVVQGLSSFIIRELLLKLCCVAVELLDHVVDVFYVVVQAVFRFLDSLEPEHGQESQNVGLCRRSIRQHLQVRSSELPSEHVCLAFLDRMLL